MTDTLRDSLGAHGLIERMEETLFNDSFDDMVGRWPLILATLKEPIWADGKHSGDCVNMPYTCNRCLVEDIQKRAKAFALAAQPAPAVMGEGALPTGNNARYAGLAGNAKWIKESATLSQIEAILHQRADLFAERAERRTAAAESREGGIKVIWHGTTDSHGTNDSKECSTGRIYTDPLMQQAYDEGFAHGAQQPGESPT